MRKTWKLLCFVSLFLLMTVGQVEAQGGTGSITIEYHGRTTENDGIPLEGASFLLYQVGEKSEEEWKLTGGFRDSGISLEDKTASGRRKQAEHLYAYAKKKQISGWQQKTDANGHLLFGGLKDGMYLIAQEQPVSYEGKGTFFSIPFLLAIPEEESGAYHRVVKPKSEWKPSDQPENPPSEKPDDKPEKPDGNGPVKTGDKAPLSELLVIICVAGIMIATLVRRR